jgi:exodeoxyribonuclease III
VRLATWNVNSLGARLDRVIEWVEMKQPDVLCMQETKQTDDAFPSAAFAALGYESAHHGEGRWNGVAIVSKVGLADPVGGFSAPEDEYGSRIIAATCDGVRVHSVYVPNGRSLDSEHYGFKLAWLARLATYLGENRDKASDVAVCGDFNIAPDDRDVWDPAQFVGVTHTSEAERAALAAVLALGFEDVWRRHHDEGGVFSWWDYRAGDFHQGRGMRIDLVLLTEALAARSTSALIDRDARKGKKPSDHAPVVVEIAAG